MAKLRHEKNEAIRKFWKSHLEQWAESGLSQTNYCRQHDLVRHRFAYWKRKFKQKNLPVEFIRITPESMDSGLSSYLKLNIGSVLQVEIPDGFSRTTLERLLVTVKVL